MKILETGRNQSCMQRCRGVCNGFGFYSKCDGKPLEGLEQRTNAMFYAPREPLVALLKIICREVEARAYQGHEFGGCINQAR